MSTSTKNPKLANFIDLLCNELCAIETKVKFLPFNYTILVASSHHARVTTEDRQNISAEYHH